MGRYLVNRLIDVARSRGVEGLQADVLVDNTRMMHVFHQCAPGPIQSTMEGGPTTSLSVWNQTGTGPGASACQRGRMSSIGR